MLSPFIAVDTILALACAAVEVETGKPANELLALSRDGLGPSEVLTSLRALQGALLLSALHTLAHVRHDALAWLDAGSPQDATLKRLWDELRDAAGKAGDAAALFIDDAEGTGSDAQRLAELVEVLASGAAQQMFALKASCGVSNPKLVAQVARVVVGITEKCWAVVRELARGPGASGLHAAAFAAADSFASLAQPAGRAVALRLMADADWAAGHRRLGATRLALAARQLRGLLRTGAVSVTVETPELAALFAAVSDEAYSAETRLASYRTSDEDAVTQATEAVHAAAAASRIRGPLPPLAAAALQLPEPQWSEKLGPVHFAPSSLRGLASEVLRDAANSQAVARLRTPPFRGGAGGSGGAVKAPSASPTADSAPLLPRPSAPPLDDSATGSEDEAAVVAPTVPRLVDAGPTALKVEWSVASDTAATETMTFDVQWRRYGEKVWNYLSSPVHGTSVIKDLLSPNTQYQFRVCASELGRTSAWGPPSPPYRTLPGRPPPVHSVRAVAIDETTATVVLKMPETDNGAAINGLTVAFRPAGSTAWQLIGESGSFSGSVDAPLGTSSHPGVEEATQRLAVSKTLSDADVFDESGDRKRSIAVPVSGLEPGTDYRIGVWLHNAHGIGAPTFSHMRTSGGASSESTGDGSASFRGVGVVEVSEADIQWDTPRKKLGQGGFGSVYRSAEGGFRGRTVAVKEMTATAAGGDSSESISALRVEVSILSGLRHPNLVCILGACLRPPKYFFVMEFAAGGSLADCIYSPDVYTTWSTDDKLAISEQVAAAMEYLHTRATPIIHRDLKPQNVVLDETHRIAKVCDFGLARARAASVIMTRVAGSFHYLAPEAFRAHQAIDEAVDVYAFAVMINELFAAQEPWPGYEMYQLTLAVAVERQRPRIGVDTPDALAALIIESWRHDATARPSFGDIRDRIHEMRRRRRLRSGSSARGDLGGSGGADGAGGDGAIPATE